MNNRIVWRGDSGLLDGIEMNLDLSKGMYDAGDLMKFGFPMAFTATMLSWAILEYGENMKTVKQLGHARDSLKWITDFLINAHPSENVLYIQVPYLLLTLKMVSKEVIPSANNFPSLVSLVEEKYKFLNCSNVKWFLRWVILNWTTNAGKDLKPSEE